MALRRIALLLVLPLSLSLAQDNDEEAKKKLLADPRYQYSQAELFVAEGNYAEAFRLYKLAADQGLPRTTRKPHTGTSSRPTRVTPQPSLI